MNYKQTFLRVFADGHRKNFFVNTLCLSFIAAIALWALVAIGVMVKFHYEVPLTAAELAGADWAYGRATAMHFDSVVAPLFFGATLILGIGLVIVRPTLTTLIPTALAALYLAFGSTVLTGEAAITRMGILDNSVTLSCFKISKSECLSSKEIRQTKAFDTIGMNSLFPLVALATAPLHMRDTEILQNRIAQQREEVARRPMQ